MDDLIVTSSPEILSAAPRVPVRTLIGSLSAGDTIDDFLEGFPTVTRDQVRSASLMCGSL